MLLRLLAVVTEAPLPTPPVTDYAGAFVKMLGTLVGLILVVFFVAWFIKSVVRGRLFMRKGAPSQITVLEQRALSPKSTLYLVEVDGARVLIAESQLDMRTLHTLSSSKDSS